jgi:hypothetical protein
VEKTMDTTELSEIALKDYPILSDDILYEIMAYYGQTYSNDVHGFVVVKYRYAYEIMTLRVNTKLAKETSSLVEKTIKVAKWTMVVGIATAIVALGTLGTFWVISLPECP